MTKRLLTLLAFIPAAVSSLAGGITLRLVSGGEISFSFDDNPVVVTGDMLEIKSSKDGTVAYPYDEVASIYAAGDAPADGIGVVSQASGSAVRFRVGDGGIAVAGLPDGARMSVYSVGGAMVASATSVGGGARVAMPQGPGVYIVKTTTGIAYKFQKKR